MPIPGPAARVTAVMDALGTGLTLILTGLLTMLGELASWPVLLSVLLGASFAYLATVEVAVFDFSSTKPEVEHHC